MNHGNHGIAKWQTFSLALLLAVPGTALAQKAHPDSIPGLELADMTPSESTALHQLVEKFPSACGKPHSLLVSLRTDPKCKRSLAGAKYIQRLLRDGFLPSEVEDRYTERYITQKVVKIDTDGAPVRGNPKAPITIVEFSDFECPSCKAAEPVLRKILEENADVKLVFLNFPLSAHPNAGPAAAAALAAGKQGKFWAYHDKLFENQGRENPADLLAYAQELKLDVARFQADMEGAKVRVNKERAQGEELKLTGTPSLFINGRPYTDPRTVEAMRSWLDEERAK